jgi:hypothetical protein
MPNKDIKITINREKIKGSVIFDTLDNYRKVNPEQTAAVILLLKEHFKHNKSECFDLNLLIPENMGAVSDTLKYSQFLVKENYSLLKSNKLISYDKALFLLLGLNTGALNDILPSNFTLFKNKPSRNSIEYSFYITLQNKELQDSIFVHSDGMISTNNLVTLANNNNFFTQIDDRISNRNLEADISKKLYKLLKEDELITGDYSGIWKWKSERNKLAYLAKGLGQKRILGNNCHKELSNYIEESNPNTNKPLKNISEISPKSVKLINDIIDALTR